MQLRFEADPEDANGKANEGRALIHELEELLKRRSMTA
jgi:hypothetical protein